MSIHDETWDKCSYCGKTVKTWHGSYHESRACLIYGEWSDYNNKLERIINMENVKIDSPKTKPVTTLYDKDYLYIEPENVNWKLMAERLWGLLDDIDTAFDHYKPTMSDRFVNYVHKKCIERQDYLESPDGHTLRAKEIPVVEDLDPMCKWFKDAWTIEKNNKR